MVQIIKWQKYLIISAALIVLNLFLALSPFLQFLWGAFYLIFFSLVFGSWLFIKQTITCKLFLGLLFVLSLASLIGTVGFYLFKLNDLTFQITLFLLPLLLLPLIIKKPLILEWPQKIWQAVNLKNVLVALIYLILILTFFYLLFSSQTGQSIRSPWEVIPKEIFFIYFMATLALFSFIIFSKSNKSLILIVIHFFASFCVALIVYQIGFDYDPFIHRTNENLILNSGTLLPKPFYYIGQYSLIIFLHKLLNFSLEWLDKLLVPFLAALYLPLTIYYCFKDNFKVKEKYLFLAILTLLAFPFTNFIVTTPQALANLFLLITLLFGIYFLFHPKISFLPLSILTLMCLSIHPLAGIPCFFFIVLLLLYHRWQKKLPIPKILHKSIFWEIVVIASLALPAAFLINSQTVSQLKVGFNSNWFSGLASLFSNNHWSLYYRPFISIHDFIYSYGMNIVPLVLLLTAIGIYYLIKNKLLKTFSIYPLMSGVLLINYLILMVGISFSSLLMSERQNYPVRALEMSLYFLLPFIILALYLFFKKVFEQKKIFIFLVTILLALALTNSFYLSYPRVDKIVEDHGYSTSISDIKTVNFIEQLNQHQPYIVLASQSVSAAAISELGFKYYYNDYYFYPVPTGNWLYQLYEDLAYQKEKTVDVIATVRYLTGVNTVYFVLNSYWLEANDTILEHQISADHWYDIDGKNYIFEYVGG